MYTFPDLLRQLRAESNLTQDQLAKALDVSTILISMVETGQKEASKGLVIKLAKKLKVQPSSIMPFVLLDQDNKPIKATGLEKTMIALGERFQVYLIKTKAKALRLSE